MCLLSPLVPTEITSRYLLLSLQWALVHVYSRSVSSCTKVSVSVTPVGTFDCTTESCVSEQRVKRPTRHFIGHFGDDFYRPDDPTNSVKALKEASWPLR